MKVQLKHLMKAAYPTICEIFITEQAQAKFP
jgi:hypothetical protein